jgi:hypothetical protein
MAMQMPALAVVVQQAMAVAKTNLARHTIHGLSEYQVGWHAFAAIKDLMRHAALTGRESMAHSC